MSVNFYSNKAQIAGHNKIVPGRRLYFTSDRSKVVEEGDPRARYLYCTEYSYVPEDEYNHLLDVSKEVQEEKLLEEPEPKPKRKTRKKRGN